VTVESHYRWGGLGSYVAELVADSGTPCRVVRCGVAEMPRGQIGTVDYLNDVHGLSGPRLAETAVDALQLAT
jgi:transketolase C-terminal domain/subunit